MSGSPPITKAEATLRALRVRFRAESWRIVDVFRRLATEVGFDGVNPETIASLQREAHKVHGTAGSFGFLRASKLAASLEEKAIAWAADPLHERDVRGAVVQQFVHDLERSFAEEV